MSALTADRVTVREDGNKNYGPVAASTTVYGGSLAMQNASGYIVPGADTASCVFAGVVPVDGQVVNSGANGAKSVELLTEGVFHFAASGLTAADVGAPLFLVDDQTVALAATTTNDVRVGTLARFISATKAAVRLDLNFATGA